MQLADCVIISLHQASIVEVGDTMQLTWKELAKLVYGGYLDFEEFVGSDIVHKTKYGAGRIVIVDGLRFTVEFTSKSVDFSLQYEIEQDGKLDVFFEAFEVPERLTATVNDARNHLSEDLLHHGALDKELSTLRARYSRIHSLYGEFRKRCFDWIMPHPSLREIDVNLAIEWLEPTADERAVLGAPDLFGELVRRFPKSWHLGRVLSARVAEIAVAQFYRTYSSDVEDISIKQITALGNGDWQRCDLRVDGREVDVKNARRSSPRATTYSEHCIPAFKKDRLENDITIAAALSPYLRPNYLIEPCSVPDHWSTEIVFLGETTWTAIEGLKRQFEKPGLLHFDFSRDRIIGRHFLPPWLFNYPRDLYRRREEELSAIRPIAERAIAVQRRVARVAWPEQIAVLIASGVPSGQIAWLYDVAQWEQVLIERIESWRSTVGLSLPHLYCTLLVHFLEMASSSQTPPDYHPARYRRLVQYAGTDKQNFPLLMADPLQIIDALIGTLSDIWDATSVNIREYREFRLQGPNILQGRKGGNALKWHTLIAYCGGSTEDGQKCGFSPLVIGQQVTCPGCGRLICPNCGYCSSNCRS